MGTPIAAAAIERGSVSPVEVGDARGWDVWPLDSGEWAWSAWIAAGLGLPRFGVEPTEAGAQETAQRELERMVSESTAASQSRRELDVPDHGPNWAPRS